METWGGLRPISQFTISGSCRDVASIFAVGTQADGLPIRKVVAINSFNQVQGSLSRSSVSSEYQAKSSAPDCTSFLHLQRRNEQFASQKRSMTLQLQEYPEEEPQCWSRSTN